MFKRKTVGNIQGTITGKRNVTYLFSQYGSITTPSMGMDSVPINDTIYKMELPDGTTQEFSTSPPVKLEIGDKVSIEIQKGFLFKHYKMKGAEVNPI